VAIVWCWHPKLGLMSAFHAALFLFQIPETEPGKKQNNNSILNSHTRKAFKNSSMVNKKSSMKSDWVVNDSIVQSVRLIQPFQWYKRYDALPFMLAYAICIPLSLLEGTEVQANHNFTRFLLCIVIMQLQLILYLHSIIL
jgi:hypothetical protein